MLRAVLGLKGKWDALNNRHDHAEPDEQIFVYRLKAKPSPVHMRGKGWFGFGEYEYLGEQPADEILRDNARWGAWCDANQERLEPEWYKKEKQQ